MRLVDLLVTIRPSPEGTPAFIRTELAYHDHVEGAQQVQALLIERETHQ